MIEIQLNLTSMCTRVRMRTREQPKTSSAHIRGSGVGGCVLSPLVTASPAVTIGGVLPAPTQPQQHTHAQTHTLLPGQAVCCSVVQLSPEPDPCTRPLLQPIRRPDSNR